MTEDKLITKMTPYLSDKIKVLSFICILMVIYVHTYYTEGEGMACFSFFSSLIGGGLCRVAVPMFYVISGYLFFLKANSMTDILIKMRKRIRTLLLPYCIANVFTFIFYVLLGLMTQYSSTLKGVVNIDILCSLKQGLWPVLELVFVNPIAFQLWFVRDLILILVFAPILYYVFHKGSKSKLGLIMLALFLFVLWWLGIDALFWFSLGGILCVVPSVRIDGCSDRKMSVLLGVLYASMCLGYAMQLIPYKYTHWIPWVGVPALWMIYDEIVKGRILCAHRSVALLCSYTFFIYLIHEPMLNIFKKLPLLFARTEGVIVVCYMLVPLIFVVFAIGTGQMVKRYLPTVYNLYTGGR